MNKPFVESTGARRPKRRQKGADDSEDKDHVGSSSFQDEPFTNQDCDEIIMFSTDFKIEYNHFDAQDTKNEHQIKMHASCKDMGVQVIQRFMQPGASQVSERSEDGSKMNIQTEVHDVIYKMSDDKNSS
jgi:hypothetical protein